MLFVFLTVFWTLGLKEEQHPHPVPTKRDFKGGKKITVPAPSGSMERDPQEWKMLHKQQSAQLAVLPHKQERPLGQATGRSLGVPGRS